MYNSMKKQKLKETKAVKAKKIRDDVCRDIDQENLAWAELLTGLP